jgi:hypothetical protein
VGLCSARDVTSCSSGCRMVAGGSSYYSPIFSLMRAEDQELGQSISHFSCFLLAGGVVWGRILRLLCLGGGPHNSPLGGFGEVDIPGGTTG